MFSWISNSYIYFFKYKLFWKLKIIIKSPFRYGERKKCWKSCTYFFPFFYIQTETVSKQITKKYDKKMLTYQNQMHPDSKKTWNHQLKSKYRQIINYSNTNYVHWSSQHRRRDVNNKQMKTNFKYTRQARQTRFTIWLLDYWYHYTEMLKCNLVLDVFLRIEGRLAGK